MIVSKRVKTLAATACAAALTLPGVGVAAAQGSLEEGFLGSSGVIPVFDSPSEGTITPLGDGEYGVKYTNGTDTDLACIGWVLPEAAAQEIYEAAKSNPEGMFPELDEDGYPIGDGDVVIGDPEGSTVLQDAQDGGHVGFMTSTDALSMRDYMRIVFQQMNEEYDEPMTPEEIEDRLDELAEQFEESGEEGDLSVGFDTGVVNFVNKGATVNWVAAMENAVPDGEKAAGIVGCFDGLSRDLTLVNTTYVEIEYAEEQVGGGEEPPANIFARILDAIDVFGSLN